MIKKLIIPAIALFLSTIATPAKADRPKIVNGQPCFEELCIGDSLTSLNIDWHSVGRVRSARNIVPKKSMLGDPTAIKEFAPYWNSGLIDSKGVAALSRIKGFCQPLPGELRGEYSDKAGRTVIVNFLLVTVDGGKSQKFVVDWIRKILPDTENLTIAQFQNIQGQLRTAYPDLVGLNLQEKSYVSVDGLLYNGTFNQTISLWGAPLIAFRGNDLFLQYPGCGGDRIIPTG
jgi:hypothetical protein